MDKKTILFAFSFQALMLFSFLWNHFFGSANGWEDLILIIQLMLTIIASIITAITLFVLRKKKLVWWHALLISIGSVLFGLGIVVLIARF